MVTKEEVERFLNQFSEKLKIYDILYRDDRGKNKKTLEELEIRPSYRTEVIKMLQVLDYVQGPIVDTLYKLGEMWVFGKDVKGKEIYIKITMGYPGSNTICISFHIAKYPLMYPFK